VLGPYSEPSYVLSIAKSPEGDYLIENNLIYDTDGKVMGWQRFYVEGNGDDSGVLWYCGSLRNFSGFVENTGAGRLNAFKFNASSSTSLTVCLDSDDVAVMGADNVNPFKFQCSHCDCSSWTISYNETSQTLLSQVTMAGSTHIKATLVRTGDASSIEAGYMPGHGADFSCDFSDGGRDAYPVDVGADADGLSAPHPVSETSMKGPGCPHLRKTAVSYSKRQLLKDSANSFKTKNPSFAGHPKANESPSAKPFEHCYSLNRMAGYTLSWSLDLHKQILHCSVSAYATTNQTWVGIGFRPMSRSNDASYNDMGTGHHNNFGMAGADIVVGSPNAGIRTLYANVYTGEPVPDTSLIISDASVSFSEADQRVTLSFSRPFVSGYLLTNYNVTASIVSPSADLLWATGTDDLSKKSQCKYHSNKRGMRVIDWLYPQYAMFDEWKC
jgi:hypothetical protein